MALTLGEAKRKALKLIDEYSINGQKVSDEKNKDYLLKMNDFADMAQQELSLFRKVPAHFEITQYTISNLISSDPGTDRIQHLKEDLTYEGVGAKSFYFEVDNIATVYIEELMSDGSWILKQTINTTNGSGFKTYKGFVSISDDSHTVRLRFSGIYVYNIRNIALYSYVFASVDAIPSYSRKVKYQMPTDFYEVDKVIFENNQGDYESLMNYYWEEGTTGSFLVVDYNYQGKIRIEYYKRPGHIDDNTSDLYEFEVDYSLQNLIPYYIASMVKADENPALSSNYRRIYETGLINLEPKREQGIEVIEDVYNW